MSSRSSQSRSPIHSTERRLRWGSASIDGHSRPGRLMAYSGGVHCNRAGSDYRVRGLRRPSMEQLGMDRITMRQVALLWTASARGWCNEEHAAYPGSNSGVQVARPRIDVATLTDSSWGLHRPDAFVILRLACWCPGDSKHPPMAGNHGPPSRPPTVPIISA